MVTYNRVLLYYLLITLLLYVDQLSKNYFVQKQFDGFLSWFNFELAFNTGSAFSLAIPLFITVGLGVVVGLAFLLAPTSAKFRKLALSQQAVFALITAGIIGNSIDRIAYGKVIDFIHISIWPIFNLADTYLTIGVIIVIAYHLFFAKHKS